MIENAITEGGAEIAPCSTDLDHSEYQWENLPHETVVTVIKAAIENQKTHCEARWGEGSFDPIVFIGEYVGSKAFFRFHRNDEAMQKLSYAWDALTQPYIKTVRIDIS